MRINSLIFKGKGGRVVPQSILVTFVTPSQCLGYFNFQFLLKSYIKIIDAIMQIITDKRMKTSCIIGVKSTKIRDKFPNIEPMGKETRSNRMVIIPIVCLRLFILLFCQDYKTRNGLAYYSCQF